MVDQLHAIRVEKRSIYDVVFLPGDDRKYHVSDDNGGVMCGRPTNFDFWCKEFCLDCYAHISDPDTTWHSSLCVDKLIVVGQQPSAEKPCTRILHSPLRSGHNLFFYDDCPRSLPFYLPARF